MTAIRKERTKIEATEMVAHMVEIVEKRPHQPEGRSEMRVWGVLPRLRGGVDVRLLVAKRCRCGGVFVVAEVLDAEELRG